MSDAFKCEICGNFYLRAERGANLSAHPKIQNKIVDVHFTVRLASGGCTSDICCRCSLTAYSRALKSLEAKK
jgi:hypothetical protein